MYRSRGEGDETSRSMKKEDDNKRFLTVSGVGALRWIDDIIYLCTRKAVIFGM